MEAGIHILMVCRNESGARSHVYRYKCSLLWCSGTLHSAFQQLCKMQFVAMDINVILCLDSNFEVDFGYLENKDVAGSFNLTIVANYFFYP